MLTKNIRRRGRGITGAERDCWGVEHRVRPTQKLQQWMKEIPAPESRSAEGAALGQVPRGSFRTIIFVLPRKTPHTVVKQSDVEFSWTWVEGGRA